VIDLTGMTYGRLTVVGYSHTNKSGKTFWKCKCECGKETVTSSDKLRRGVTRSCGCLRKELYGKAQTTHGMTKTKLYVIWSNMRSRCMYRKNSMYHNYGGRGISLCEDWKNFDSFRKWAEKNGYKEGLSIERIDVNGNYEPKNCTWIPKSKQLLNQRRSHLVTAFGKTQTIKEWSDESGIKYDTIERRLNSYGWNPADAVSVPPHGRG